MEACKEDVRWTSTEAKRHQVAKAGEQIEVEGEPLD